MVVEGACFLVVLIGRLGRRGTRLVGILNEVPAAVKHEFGPHAVHWESRAPPDLLEEDELARPVADVEGLRVLIGELRGDQLGDDVEFARQLRVCAGDEAHGSNLRARTRLVRASRAVSLAPRRGTWPQRGRRI